MTNFPHAPELETVKNVFLIVVVSFKESNQIKLVGLIPQHSLEIDLFLHIHLLELVSDQSFEFDIDNSLLSKLQQVS